MRTVYLQHTVASQGHCHPTSLHTGANVILVHNVPKEVTDLQVSQRMSEVGTWKVTDIEWVDCIPGALLKI